MKGPDKKMDGPRGEGGGGVHRRFWGTFFLSDSSLTALIDMLPSRIYHSAFEYLGDEGEYLYFGNTSVWSEVCRCDGRERAG